MRHRLALVAFAAALAAPSLALAGGCPTCTSDADCVDPGGGAGFCVEWSRDFGCGDQRIACCPGQACNTFSGRPSCEGVDADGDGTDDCTVLGAGVDAGAPMDAGGGSEDAGSAGSDASASATDGGGVATDAGGPGPMDAGGGGSVDAGTGGTDGGCGCRAGGGGSPRALALAIPFLAAILSARGASRRRRP